MPTRREADRPTAEGVFRGVQREQSRSSSETDRVRSRCPLRSIKPPLAEFDYVPDGFMANVTSTSQDMSLSVTPMESMALT